MTRPNDIDITSELSSIVAPTLVLHVRGDARSLFDEGRKLAAGIKGARFVPLEGRNHALLPGDIALQRYLQEIDMFLRN